MQGSLIFQNNVTISMVRENEAEATVVTPEQAFEQVREIGYADRELIVAILLDTPKHVVGVHLVSMGSVDCSVASPREVFKAALLTNAVSVILAHNHPGGSLGASREDQSYTKRMVEAGNLMGVEILDHIIVAGDQWSSMRTDHSYLWR